MLQTNSLIDLKMTEDGELVIGPDGDFMISLDSDALEETIMFRLKTYSGDFSIDPHVGASIESIIGEDNSPETGAIVEALVYNSLTNDGLLDPQDFNLEVFPVSKTEIAILAIIRPSGDRGEIRLAFSYNSQDNKIVQRNL